MTFPARSSDRLRRWTILALGAGALLLTTASVAGWNSRALASRDPGLVQSPEHRYQVRLGSEWRALPVAPDSRIPQAGFEHGASGATLAINRIDYPNLAAWRKKSFPTYADEIEEGFRAAVRGYQRDARRTHKIGNIPSLDLTFRHRADSGDQQVHVRMIFYRRYSLSCVASIPVKARRRHQRAPRDAVASFEPYFRP